MNKKTLPKDGFIARRLQAYNIDLPTNICPLTRAFLWAMVLTALWPLWFPGYYLMRLFKFNTETNPDDIIYYLRSIDRRSFSGEHSSKYMKKQWNYRVEKSKEFDAADRVMGFLCGLLFTSSLVGLYSFLSYSSIDDQIAAYSIIVLAFWVIGLLLGLKFATRNYAIYKLSDTPQDYIDRVLGKKQSRFRKAANLYFSPAVELWDFARQRYKDFKEKTCTPIDWN